MIRNHPLPGVLLRKWITPIYAKLTSPPRIPIILDGQVGIGKTHSLNHLVANFKSSSDYSPIMFHIPNLAHFFEGRYPYNLNNQTNQWEIPIPTQDLLTKFVTQNSSYSSTAPSILKSTMIQSTYTFPNSTTVPASSSLHDLVSVGLNHVELSSSVFQALCTELLALPSSVIAVDHVNALFSKAYYFSPLSKQIPALQFTLGHCLSLFFNKEKAKGIVVGATSRTDPRFQGPEMVNKLIPNGVEFVQVPPYDQDDARRIVDLYASTNVLLTSPAKKLLDIDRLLLLSGGNPKKFYEIARNPMLF